MLTVFVDSLTVSFSDVVVSLFAVSSLCETVVMSVSLEFCW